MKELKFGDVVSFDTKQYGMGKGQVIDMIESKGVKYMIIEPIYQTSEKRLSETIIKVEASSLKRISVDDVDRRIRMR
ncbi:MAG: hypothetical protein Q8S24_00030 [Eubacteriales bacterium]|nr:hypothetical protein [Eubacteriales bacterium]